MDKFVTATPQSSQPVTQRQVDAAAPNELVDLAGEETKSERDEEKKDDPEQSAGEEEKKEDDHTERLQSTTMTPNVEAATEQKNDDGEEGSVDKVQQNNDDTDNLIANCKDYISKSYNTFLDGSDGEGQNVKLHPVFLGLAVLDGETLGYEDIALKRLRNELDDDDFTMFHNICDIKDINFKDRKITPLSIQRQGAIRFFQRIYTENSGRIAAPKSKIDYFSSQFRNLAVYRFNKYRKRMKNEALKDCADFMELRAKLTEGIKSEVSKVKKRYVNDILQGKDLIEESKNKKKKNEQYEDEDDEEDEDDYDYDDEEEEEEEEEKEE